MFAAQCSTIAIRLLVSLFASVGISPACSQDADVSSEAILHDPVAPVAGNPNGDTTVVTFFDYN